MSELTGPSQAVLVSSRAMLKDALGVKYMHQDNISVVAWHMNTSSVPPLYAISMNKKLHSYRMIDSSKVFAVNFMPYLLQEKTIGCGKMSGAHQDKFNGMGIGKIEAEKIDCPLVKEAIGYLECEVINTIETGDNVIFIGQILRSELKEQAKRLYHIDGNEFTTTS